MKQRKKIGIFLEKFSIFLIGLGFLMLIQPFLMNFFTYGFSVTLAGVVLFNIASHI
jgi:hypothetical protein